jgi:lysophospholipid acyltransferase (LPLAT)-like uncharacterized protein
MRRLFRRAIRAERVRHALCRLIAAYIRFVHATGRWTVEGGDIPKRLHEAGQPFILAFWHGRLLMMPMAWDPRQPIHMLISAHRDGRIIADAVKHFGIRSVAGSTSRGGAGALRAMLRTLRSGACVGITPDGPRGPAMQASLGTVAAARLAGAPVVPLSYGVSRRWVLGTWDGFQVALPFCRGVFVWGEPITVPPEADEAALESFRLMVEERLTALGEHADRSMGHGGAPPPRLDGPAAAVAPATGDPR